MTSRSIITSAAFAGVVVSALAACSDNSPDLTIKGTRDDTTTEMDIELCPLASPANSADCTTPVNLFAGVTDRQRTADVYIGDTSVALTAYIVTPNVICEEVAVTLQGQVHLDYTSGADTAACSPMDSCIPDALSPTCGE
jgi:hypothetical protein